MTERALTSDRSSRGPRLVLALVVSLAVTLGATLALGLGGAYQSLLSHAFAIACGIAFTILVSRHRNAHPIAISGQSLFDAETLERVRLASQAAGIRVFDYNLITGRLIVDESNLDVYSDEARASAREANAAEFVHHIVHPDDLAHHAREMMAAVRSKTHFTFGYRSLHRDGSAHPVRLHGQVVRNAAGRAIRVIGVTLDMSDQADALQKIEQQACDQQRALERLDLATQAAGIGIWDMDMVTEQLAGDTNMAQVWEQRDKNAFPSLVEFLRKAVHAEDLKDFERALLKTMKFGTSVEHRYREVRPDGAIGHIQFHGRMFRDDAGKPLRFLAVTLDVTAQAEAAQALEAQAQQQATLLDRLNLATHVGGIGVWDWDAATDSMTIDAAIARGYGLKDLRIERDALAFCTRAVYPPDAADFIATIRNALVSGETVSHRHRIVVPNGPIRTVQFHAQVFRDDTGKATRVLGVTIDVTAQSRHAEQLSQRVEEERALRDRLNLATQTAGIGVWDMSFATRKITADENTHQLLGCSADIDEAMLRSIIHPDDSDRVWQSIMAPIADAHHDGIVSVRHRIVRRDDALTRHIQTHIRVTRDAAGKPVRMLGVTWDVSAEVEHALKLEAQTQHVQSLLDRLSVASQAAGISAWGFDLKTRKYLWVENRTRALGLEHVALEDYDIEIRKLIHPEDLQQLDAAAREAFASGKQSYTHRFRVIRPDGSVRHLQSYTHITRDEQTGRAIRLLGATADVTNEVQTTELLQRQAAQERALNDRLAIATEAAGIGTFEIDLAAQKLVWVENPIKGIAKSISSMPTLKEYEQFVHPEDVDALPNALRAAFAAGSTRLSYNYRALADDGNYVYVKSHAYLLPNEQGKLLRLLGVSWDGTKDIEAAKNLEQQARHERMLLDRLSMATEAAGICSWEIDLDTGKFLWTENWLKALGDSRPEDAESTDAFLASRLHPEDRTVLNDAITSTLREKGDRFSRRYRAIGKDGNVVYVQTHARLVFDENGWAHRLLGVSWDITHEIEAAARDVDNTRRLEDQAQHQRVLLERLKLSSVAAGICSFEIDMELGVFLWSENPIVSMTDMDLKGVTIDTFSELLIIPEDRDAFRNAARQALKEKRNSYSFRYRGRGKDGNLVYVETHAHFVQNDSGRAVRLLGVSWDTTSSVVAAQKLEEQSIQQRVLLDRLSIATQVADISSWELDLVKLEFLWIENPIAALLRPGDDRYSLASLQERVIPEDHAIMREQIAAAMAAGNDRMSYRYRGVGIDGNTVHVQNYVKLFFNGNGEPISALGASWDITKEIEAAERLEQQAEQLRIAERRLERASLSSSEGHWEADLVNRRVWVSSSYCSLLGFKEGELPTNLDGLEAMFHPDDFAANRAVLSRHIETGATYVADSRMRCGNGEYRWFRQRGTAERDANGHAISMSGSVHDIHEQKLAEDALQLAQRRFERAINGTQDGLWELESTGTAWCSPRVGELLGYRPEDFPSDTNFLREYLHPDDATAVASATQAHFQQELPYDVEIRLRTKTGDYRWYRARAKAERDTTGRPLRMSGSLQDVTEARGAREALVSATEAAEAASRAKSFFLANVSHEIRTPMNGIIGMTGLMLDTALDRTQRDYAETIRSSADSLLIVINDILDFSKIEAGKMEIEEIELDLRGNVEDVGSMMAFQAAAKNLELVVHVHPDIPERVTGDPQRIRQCLINLVGNAIKFTRSGEIVIEVSNVGEENGKVLTQFQVRDTGIGIAPETLKTLFQPFVQADASTTRHFGGTGLGLSIVRRLVQMMGGTVGIESQVGEGSTFWFTLPLEPAVVAQNPHQPDLHRLGRRVLIVDDHETNRRVLAGQLIHAGYEVSLGSSGADALQILRQGLVDKHPYDIVLADYQMDDMDGATLGQQINSDPQLSHARIVILTSLDRHGDIRRFASLGFAGYLTKPVRARELLDCLDRVLARGAKEWHLQSQPIVTRGTLVSDEPARRYEGHVLLVEDNAVNQKVAVRFLERMGCQVRVADNGEEGVKAYQQMRFDLVLMDLQMPIMDGLTATRRIREIEGTGSATPIVALTANAMTGQLERCMEAGMNGFLTKPLEIARLHETLELYGLAVRAVDTPRTAADAPAAPVNLARLNEITDGDPEFAFELATTFIASGEQVLNEVNAAMSAFDRGALSRAAHKLKGASANIHAEALRELAYLLESQAGSVDQSRLKEIVAQLRVAFETAAEFLRAQAPQPEAKAG